MLNSLRPLLTKFLEPLAKRLNINPNIVTIISPFLALISAIFFAYGNLLCGALFILLSGFLDVVDGAVARYHNRASPFGAFLDSTMDRFADAIIYIGIIFGGYCDWFVGVLAILLYLYYIIQNTVLSMFLCSKKWPLWPISIWRR